MTQRSRIPISRVLLFAALVFVFGVGGVLAGDYIRRALSPRPTMTALAPHSLLEKGMPFPEVSLTGEDGRTAGTGELRGNDGCVILFLDLGCPPYGEMAQKWQEALDSGQPPGLRVFGVTNHPVEAIEGFRLDYGTRFPIYQDAGKVFLNTYDVDRFPLEVIIGASGKIRGVSYDAESPVDPAAGALHSSS